MGCITEILKIKGDKEVFIPAGEWIAVEGGGDYKDYEYIIVLNTRGFRCGYIALPVNHPYTSTPKRMDVMGHLDYEYYALEIDVHGGLTFMSAAHGLKDILKTPCSDIWIGFDCGHYLDKLDSKMFIKYFGEEEYKKNVSFFSAMNHADIGINQTLKDYEYVEDQCKHVIDQLNEKFSGSSAGRAFDC